jgi:hypothetical protein
MKHLKSLKPAAALLFLGSCVSGPTDDRTFAEKMHGDNYQDKKIIMGVPILERKLIQRKISGRVFCGEGISQTPANHAVITIHKENKNLGTASTDASGSYTLLASMDPLSTYEIRATGSCGKATATLEKGASKESPEIHFFLKK